VLPNVINDLYATLDPRLSVGLQTGTNVGAGCSCHPTGFTIIARLAFVYILSGQGQLHAFRDRLNVPAERRAIVYAVH
jgi:hypothetical protein